MEGSGFHRSHPSRQIRTTVAGKPSALEKRRARPSVPLLDLPRLHQSARRCVHAVLPSGSAALRGALILIG